MTIPPERTDSPSPANPALFAPRPAEPRGFPLAPVVAGAVILALVLVLLLVFHRRPAPPSNAARPIDPYAASLSLSQLAMSESSSLSGGKSTFLDGHIANTGSKVVTGVTVQVFFRNDESMPPQIETLPLSLIRTHEPYVDTQSVSASPIKPSDNPEFRLIFESVPANWNTQMPEIHIVHVDAH